MEERDQRPSGGLAAGASAASLALALAVIGIYGVISYSVTQRTHEIGVRLALGAGLNDVLQLVVGQGLRLAFVGIGIGFVGALWASRVLHSMLFGIQPTDLATFVLVPLILLPLPWPATSLLGEPRRSIRWWHCDTNRSS